MKTSRSVIISALLAAVVLRCDSVNPQLRSLNDLRNIDFGQSVPKHTLLLLHWFANVIGLDDYDGSYVRLTFDPNTDYGSHHFGNFQHLLDPLPRGYQYYTVGNLNDEFPAYVRNPPVREYAGQNQGRIIFRVHVQSNRIDRVYITQHARSSSDYDQDHTYQISINLLRQIREFSHGNPRSLRELRDRFHINADDSQLWDLSHTWGNLACLGLLLFMVTRRSARLQAVLTSSSTRGNDATETCRPAVIIVCLLMLAVIIIGFINHKQP